MKTESVSDRITEKEVLNSLEAAISSYAIKDFESITKKTLKNTRVPKRTKKQVEKKVETTVIKNKSKRSSKKKKSLKKPIYRRGILKSIRRRSKSFSKNLGSFFGSHSKQLTTLGLTVFMVGFVSYSTYIAYAFMSGANADVVTKVGSHVILPTGETPKIYVIQSDKSEIFQNPLFSGIAVGDNVLTYQDAGKVIIYRAKEDKVVNIVNTK